MDPIRLRLMTDDVSDEYTDSIGGVWTDDWAVDHDRRGYTLSVELEAALGPEYDLVYHPETRVVRAEIEAAGGKTEHWSRRPPLEARPGARWVAHRPGSERKDRPRTGSPDDQT